MQNAKCRTDAAERGHSVLAHCAEPQGGKACKAGLMQNAKLFFLPKFSNFSNFPKFSKSNPFQKPPYSSSEGVRCGASQKKRPRDRQPMTLTIIMGEGIF